MNRRRELKRRERQERRLIYCYKRCPCGALYAYDPAERPRPLAWDCSDIILGQAIPSGYEGSVTHGDTMPFIFWEVKAADRQWALDHRVEQ
jgi:hypothetical protein